VNAAAHSYGGSAVCSISPEGIDITVADEGPGIPDLDLAMTEGYSTAAEEIRELGYGAGMGLPNILNNTDELSIDTGENVGTTVQMRIWFSGTRKEGGAEPEQEPKQELNREQEQETLK
jgi:anti-sigma regulatory factor (Ser/Thr protein kinase)